MSFRNKDYAMAQNIKAVFERYTTDFLKFERITNPLNPRPDVCAFLMLQALAPDTSDIVSAAEHDRIWLDVDMDVLSEAATEEQLRDLHRCGVCYDREYDCLSMLV
jgi:hypothetical protein